MPFVVLMAAVLAYLLAASSTPLRNTNATTIIRIAIMKRAQIYATFWAPSKVGRFVREMLTAAVNVTNLLPVAIVVRRVFAVVCIDATRVTRNVTVHVAVPSGALILIPPNATATFDLLRIAYSKTIPITYYVEVAYTTLSGGRGVARVRYSTIFK